MQVSNQGARTVMHPRGGTYQAGQNNLSGCRRVSQSTENRVRILNNVHCRHESSPIVPGAMVGSGVGVGVNIVGSDPVTGVTVMFPVPTTVPVPTGKSPADRHDRT